MAVVIQTLFGLEVKNHHCTLSLASMCLLQMWFRSSMCLDRWSRHGDWSHCFQSCRCILAHFENVATVCYMLNEDFGHVGHLIFTSYTDHYFITQVTPECRIWTNLWKVSLLFWAEENTAPGDFKLLEYVIPPGPGAAPSVKDTCYVVNPCYAVSSVFGVEWNGISFRD